MTKKILGVSLMLFVLLPMSVQAISTEDPSGTLGLGTADLKETVLNIITLVLGLLGIIAVVMILWGGFQWMTAGGNTERVDSAKKVLSAAIFGLIIIILAWAIVNFVIRTTSNVSGA